MASSALVQRAYTAIVRHFLDEGRAPHYTELANLLGVAPDSARDLQRDAAEASPACWLEPETEYIASWAPFSNIPTQTRISVDGKERWYGQ